jgi:hypothetical protein
MAKGVKVKAQNIEPLIAKHHGNIITRLVTVVLAETWRRDPEVMDGNGLADAADDTEFA